MQKNSKNPLVFYSFLFISFLLTSVFAENSIKNLTNFQVIQRTSETYADIPVFGYHDFSIGTHIQVRICRQINNEVLKNFNWIPVDTSFSSMTWKGVIRHVPVGGEYSIQFNLLIFENQPAKPFATIEHVLVGDIWGAGGQSNMLGEGDPGLSDKPIDQVHVITYDTGWKKAQEPIGGVGCGPALRFALRVFSATNVPVGLAFYAAGGTNLYYWEKEAEGFEKWTSIFNRAGGELKGIIWYQGESHTGTLEIAMAYKNLMKVFMSDIRNYLNNPRLPWILAQISTNCEVTSDMYAPITREAQREISIEDSNATTITTIDVPRNDCYHFETPQYQIIGNRFASAALNRVYGKKTEPLGPRFSYAYFTDSTNKCLELFCDNITDIIKPASGFNGFAMWDSGIKIFPASTARTDSNSVMIKVGKKLSDQSTLCFGYGYDPANFICSDSSNIGLQAFYFQPILKKSEIPKQGKNQENQNGPTATNSTIDIAIKENPFRLYGVLLISFSQIKSSCAELSIYRFDGAIVRQIKLASRQDRITISGKYLPAGCYVFRIRDGKATGSKKIIWNFR